MINDFEHNWTVAGVTILYNPDIKVISNIKTYLNQVDKVFVYDNSEITNKNIVDKLLSIKRVVYTKNTKNMGIAYTLNKAAEVLVSQGYKYLFAMDQDSSASEYLLREMLNAIEKDEKIGLVSPKIKQKKSKKNYNINPIVEVNVAITSGSLTRLSAHKKISGYNEKLFIDYVDHEYCLRLKSNGYKVIESGPEYINHELGNIKEKRILFWHVYPTNHKPARLYYRTRNRLFVYNLYNNIFPDYVRKDKISFIKEILKIFIFEKQKIQKCKMIIKGYLDYKSNVYGYQKSILL